MKEQEFLKSLGNIDPELVEQAAPAVKKKHTHLLRRVGLIAACFLLIAGMVGGAVAWSMKGNKEPAENPAKQSGETQSEAPGETSEDQTRGTDVSEPEKTFEGVRFLKASSPLAAPEQGAVSEEFKAAYADLAIRLLEQSRAQQGEQVMVSPLSLLEALGMAANGAKGNTLAEMEAVLGLPVDKLNEQLFNFVKGLKSTEKTSFSSANSMWVAPHMNVKDSFLAKIENVFLADVAQMDFLQDGAADRINAWCAEKTKNMIPELYAPNQKFDERLAMVLINALCFDGEWKVPYSDNNVADGIFVNDKNQKQTVSMLHGTDGLYFEGKHETGLVKFYEGKQYAFVGILPKKTGDLGEYLKTFDGDTFRKLVAHASIPGEFYTTIPEFKSEASVSMNDILQGMGMKQAFTKDADFTGIGTPDVYISSVRQKTFIEVNAHGTKAAAVTGVEFTTESIGDVKHVDLDRPFVYAIIDVSTGLPLFIGTCENIA